MIKEVLIKQKNTPPISYTKKKFKLVTLTAFLFWSSITPAIAAIGDPFPTLTSAELAYFERGKELFEEQEVKSLLKRNRALNPNITVLGPRFNLDSCAGCHLAPAVGGSSPATNPQIAVATRLGARNIIPGFITLNGPVREARFKFNPDGSRDGGVHALFVITGRSDAGACNIQQPDFAAAASRNNLSFRIPTPLFGTGLMEAIPDAAIIANKNANLPTKRDLGISGHENRSGNDGTITRFGWKAQNKSLLVFSGEAYNVEMGVTNELFPTERDEGPGCAVNPLPEDHTNFELPAGIDATSDAVLFTEFMRFLAPPVPKPLTPTAQRGSQLFNTVGCAMCHTPSMKTGPSFSASLSNKTVNLFSDLLVHKMGERLADNIIQGRAGVDEFRTAPLWGVGQRLFFLHDGRTNDLTTAIQFHADSRQSGSKSSVAPSEANAVIAKFNALSSTDRANMIEFLKSL